MPPMGGKRADFRVSFAFELAPWITIPRFVASTPPLNVANQINFLAGQD